jgi:hypothetical protein
MDSGYLCHAAPGDRKPPEGSTANKTGNVSILASPTTSEKQAILRALRACINYLPVLGAIW